jgi:hypothetical protein
MGFTQEFGSLEKLETWDGVRIVIVESVLIVFSSGNMCLFPFIRCVSCLLAIFLDEKHLFSIFSSVCLLFCHSVWCYGKCRSI